MALLVSVGVDEEGFREVLAVEVAGTEKGPRVSWSERRPASGRGY